MSSISRLNQIVEIVQKKGEITIDNICQMFEVSEMTARRDLNELGRQGLLRRVHGGAVANLGRSYEPPFRVRANKNQPQKTLIGLCAAEMIYDGDSIALDIGTSTLEIIKGLKGKHNLTIITSGLQAANMIVDSLSLEMDVRLIITGGIIRPRELSMIGNIPEWVFSQIHVDKAFIGISGISLEDGLTEYNIDDARNKEKLILSAREKIVVADGSKFGVTTLASVAPLNKVDKIITDKTAPIEMIKQIRKTGVEVIVADEGNGKEAREVK